MQNVSTRRKNQIVAARRAARRRTGIKPGTRVECVEPVRYSAHMKKGLALVRENPRKAFDKT